MNEAPRLSWPEYFMNIAFLVAERSTCLRRKVGAVAVKDRRILSTGYNGVPRGIEHCASRGCIRVQRNIPSGEHHEICRGVHAEQNVIIQAALYGLVLSGAELYCTTQPCLICTKLLINCGIRRIICAESYPDEMALEMLKEAGTELVIMPFERRMPNVIL
ncbi:MAG: cytidine/deoxycytidylate deaminase family protein [Mailhella sp.]|nr:cytidine/deoxycytidylate deaminase family protein [Mailhella sp.]